MFNMSMGIPTKQWNNVGNEYLLMARKLAY